MPTREPSVIKLLSHLTFARNYTSTAKSRQREPWRADCPESGVVYATYSPLLVWRACPTATKVSRISSTIAARLRPPLNWLFTSATLAGSPCSDRAARTDWTRSGNVAGHGCFLILAGDGFGRLLFLGGDVEAGLRSGLACGVLKFGTQPADLAAGFFRGSLVVEIDQTLEDLFVAQIARPAVSVDDRRVQFVVDLLEDRDEALFVDVAFFFGEFSFLGGRGSCRAAIRGDAGTSIRLGGSRALPIRFVNRSDTVGGAEFFETLYIPVIVRSRALPADASDARPTAPQFPIRSSSTCHMREVMLLALAQTADALTMESVQRHSA